MFLNLPLATPCVVGGARMKHYCVLSLLIVVLLLGGCASQETARTAAEQPAAIPEKAATPSAQAQQVTQPVQASIDADVAPLLKLASTKVKSLNYHYSGPESDNQLYDIFIKGTKMAYLPFDKNDYSGPTAYNIIFLDTAAKTAMSYCTHQTCTPKGKRGDLTYSAVYIATPLDWIVGITSAKKAGSETIDKRAVTIVETNKGKMWIENFFGVPVKIEKDGTTYSFQQMAFNGVLDTQVNP